jgi:transposase-like protein
MQQYSEAFKSKMVQRMLGPRGVSASALASETGLHQPTLSRWLRAAGATMPGMSSTTRKSSPPVSSPARRPEDWKPEERLRAVLETSALSDAGLGEYLRANGLHEATLAEWRATALEALGTPRPSAKEAKRVRELERELRRKDRALAETAALLVLQKKAQAIWGDADASTDPRSDD